MAESPRSPRVDPITLEIIRGSLASAIRDMELLMERCAMSPFIKEKKDYFVGIFDTRGRIVACHISGSGPGMLQPILKLYPLDTMRPGDVYWFNDPYISDGAVQHHQDMVFTVPVFHEGRPVAFATTFGHYQDIGGLRAGSISPHATEIYHEGVLVPPVRIVREGQLNEEAYRIFLRNSRLPDLVEGDTRAMMASCHLAETRLGELCARYGADDSARRLRRVHRPDRGAGARAVPRAGAAGGVALPRLPRQRRRGRGAAVSHRSHADARGRPRAARRLATPTTRRAARSTSPPIPGCSGSRSAGTCSRSTPISRSTRGCSRTSTSGSPARAASSSRAFPRPSACAPTPGSG